MDLNFEILQSAENLCSLLANFHGIQPISGLTCTLYIIALSTIFIFL